jgi:hypothetical protein
MSERKLTILQLNDLHGYIEPGCCVHLCVGSCYLPHRPQCKFPVS